MLLKNNCLYVSPARHTSPKSVTQESGLEVHLIVDWPYKLGQTGHLSEPQFSHQDSRYDNITPSEDAKVKRNTVLEVATL